jgi:hypothetical protein
MAHMPRRCHAGKRWKFSKSDVGTSIMLLLVLCAIQAPRPSWSAEEHKFRADEWVTECDPPSPGGAPDCSIMVPFWQSHSEPSGSFALVVMLQSGNIGIVGRPYPVRAMLRVDKNLPVECNQPRYCVFPTTQALAILQQLKVGSLILIDVFTARGTFNFSLTPKGYRAGLARIRAWGYRTD